MTKTSTTSKEFVVLMASLMSIVALAIDALLPALDIIGETIGTKSIVDNQLLITMIFLGLGVGPLLFGPISDSLGRKPVVYMGISLFIIASLICVFSKNLETMIAGRILQGVALSAPRTISIAMIRDIYSGDYMARIMSFITVVFLLVPIIAPALGKFILDHYNWQAIFYVQIVFGLIVSLWFWRRQAETLIKVNRIPFTIHIFSNGIKELSKHKTTIGYTFISGFITASFLVYLSSSQQIFAYQYQMAEEFPYIFAGLAISVGTATFLNGTLVLKYGMEKLVTMALVAYFAISFVYVLLYFNSPNPGVLVLLSFFALQFFAIGFLFGNLRALAMQPIGHIAGIGAAITGFVSTLMAVPISTYIGRFVSDTALPLFIGFSICGFLSVLILIYLRSPKKQRKPDIASD